MDVCIGACSWSLRAGTPQDLAERLQKAGLSAVQLAIDPIRKSVWSVDAIAEALDEATDTFQVDKVFDQYMGYAERFKRHLVDTVAFLNRLSRRTRQSCSKGRKAHIWTWISAPIPT